MTFWTRNGREDGAAHGYRNLGIFWEAATNKILDDFVTACRPRRMHVTGAFTARGGITTTVVADYGRHGGVKRRGSSDALS